ncbi:MAG: O-antigen ligase family protein, partial [Anaerolineales bacterium]|nr:O-antigen ligase family protein [Anaerolineales bacterium]
MKRILRFFQASEPIAWALAVLLLPLTSVPLLARLTGAATVAPISALPVAWLVAVFFIPYLLQGGRLPRQMLPFFVFIGMAVVASAAAYFLDVPYYRNRDLLGEQIPAFATLALGAAYYLIFATWPRSESRLQLTLKLINIGGIFIIIWSMLQAGVIWGLNGRYPAVMIQIQAWLSLQDFIPGRVSGFTYEPSWLAHQLNILYLPFWLAASVGRYSAHRFRFGPVSVENLLLLGGVGVLLFSFSRVGILAFLIVCAFLIGRQALHWASRWSERPRRGREPSRLARLASQAGLLLGFGLLLLVGFAALIFLMGRVDERLASLFDPENLVGASFYDITNQLAFAERVVYWATGWEVFNEYPLLGVGLGTT